MKKSIKILAAILATLMLVSFIPLAAFAEEIETVTEDTETEAIEESSSEIYAADSESGDLSDTECEETATMIFEFIEPELPGISRMIGGGEVGFGPPDGDSDTPPVTSKIIPDGVYAIESAFAPGLWMDVNDVTEPGYNVWQDYYYICDVTIPAGTKIYSGIVNPMNGNSGMGIQYDLDWKNQVEWFSNERPLP